MAETAADAGNEAAFAEFSAGGEAFAASGATELAPKAEGGGGRNFDAVQGAGGDAEVFYFSRSQGEFGRCELGPKRHAEFGDGRGVLKFFSR